MRYSFSFKVNFKGGIVSPGVLQNVLLAVKEARLEHVRFGLRQQLLVDASAKQFQGLQNAFNEAGVSYEVNSDEFPNIVSSYPAASVFIENTWLSEGVYKDVFDLLDYTPRLKLNICDNNQTFTPFFTGHINWIGCSSHVHYWFLFIRFPKTQTLFQWPELVYTNDIARVSKEIEAVLLKQSASNPAKNELPGDVVYAAVKQAINYNSRSIDEELVLPSFRLPYYEGFNSSEGKYWLGIYQRDELFDVEFLLDICAICLETKVGQLYTTPWKSIIIKGIEASKRKLWDYALNSHRINVRHAANELNWQTEDTTDDGLYLKKFIMQHFDKEDLRTHGLCFAIKTLARSNVFGSIVIKKRDKKGVAVYDISYARNFNPNVQEYIVYRENVQKEHLGIYLVSLVKLYYEEQREENIISSYTYNQQPTEEQPVHVKDVVHQCVHCLSVYEEKLGDAENSVEAGTLFADLPDHFSCVLCGASKDEFKEVEKSTLELQVV
jgi:rubredoxin